MLTVQQLDASFWKAFRNDTPGDQLPPLQVFPQRREEEHGKKIHRDDRPLHPGLHRYGRPVGFQLDTHSGLGEDGNYIPETAELIVAEKPGIQRGIVTVDAPGGHVAGEVAAALAARFSWRHLTEENISTNDLADLDECVVSGRTSGRRMADALVRFWIPDPGGSHPADPATGPDIDAMALDPKLPISVLIARMEERVRIASLQRRM